MDKERVSIYTRRITESNRSELIVVLYDLFFEYLDSSEYEKAEEVLRHLMNDLDFRYEISGNLYSLYDFCMRRLASLSYKSEENGNSARQEIHRVMGQLREAFEEVAKADQSAPLMQNAQQMTAGYTYGRFDVNQTEANYDRNRGFQA